MIYLVTDFQNRLQPLYLVHEKEEKHLRLLLLVILRSIRVDQYKLINIWALVNVRQAILRM